VVAEKKKIDRMLATTHILWMMGRILDAGFDTGFGLKGTRILEEDILMDRRWCLYGLCEMKIVTTR
jgi:hypothetical protein